MIILVLMNSYSLFVITTLDVKLILIVRCTRATEEESDRFIFDLFNLNTNSSVVSKEALTTMMYNLP